MFGCAIFFILYHTILYYIQNCEYWENIFFKIIFEWFRKSETKLNNTWVEFKFNKTTQTCYPSILT
jgi:hypothetical protein